MNGPVHLGKYRLIRLLGRGGMGEVYLARHEGPAGFERTVVVKRVLRRFADDARLSEMIVNEARVAAMVIHPNAVQVYELGHEGGEYFIAMEYVHGRSLHQVMERAFAQGPVPPSRAAQVVWQLLQGLHAVHRGVDSRGRPLGIVHRDVSPDNVLISFEGVVKVTDFGIMKSGSLSNALEGVVQGKLAYLSPEQSVGQPVDPRADLYAAGILLYELLAGTPPFVGADRDEQLEAIQRRAPPALDAKRPDVPPALNAIVLRALEKDPAKRFQTAQEMAAALESVVTSASESLTPGPIAGWMEALFPGEAALPPSAAKGAPQGTHPLSATGTQASTLAVPAQQRVRGARRARLFAAGLLALGVLGAVAAGARFFPKAKRTEPEVPTASGATAPALAQAPSLSPAPEAPPDASLSVTVAASTPVLEPVVDEKPTTPSRPPQRASSRARTGKLSVRVNPWAEVWVNGKHLGVSPVGPVSVPAGRVELMLQNPELGVTRRVRVAVVPNGTLLWKEDLLARRAGDRSAR